MSTSTDVETFLDQQTRDDMRPPCDSITPDDERCPNPAEWVSRIECDQCPSRHTLDCNPCKEALLAGAFICYGCSKRVRVIASERL